MKTTGGVIALALALAACAGPTIRGGAAQVVETGLNALPAPTSADYAGSARPYEIGPFDRLEIDVYGVEDLKREVQADAAGRVSFPLAGTIEASGKSPSELAAIIAERLQANYIRDPQVTVNLKETMSQLVTVDGEVKDPGVYPVVGGMTLTRAVATAKGATEFADLGDVVVLRTVDGQKLLGVYNLGAIRNGRYADPEIYANDVVIVGEANGRRLFRDAIAIGPAILAPLIYLIR